MLGNEWLASDEVITVTCHDIDNKLQRPPTMADLFCVLLLPKR